MCVIVIIIDIIINVMCIIAINIIVNDVAGMIVIDIIVNVRCVIVIIYSSWS